MLAERLDGRTPEASSSWDRPPAGPAVWEGGGVWSRQGGSGLLGHPTMSWLQASQMPTDKFVTKYLELP